MAVFADLAMIKAADLVEKLGQVGDESSFAPMIESLGSVALPGQEEDDEDQHYDWVVIRKQGIELGFSDAAYFDGRPRAFWRKEGLILNQLTFYGGSREGLASFKGQLPYGLSMSDTQETTREKLAAHEASRRSYVTDRWDIESHRLIVSYRSDGGGLDSVHVKLSPRPLDESLRLQPDVSPLSWMTMFGWADADPRLAQALLPLDLKERIEEGEDDREVDFIAECGLELYFEKAERLRVPAECETRRQAALALGAVKFHRARDLEAREYSGVLPFDLNFADSPAILEKKIGIAPDRRSDGKMTGHALWHLADCSLQILYSTIENHLFRITLMAPGYWHDLGDDV